MIDAPTRVIPLRSLVRRITARLDESSLRVADMSRGAALELDRTLAGNPRDEAGAREIRRMEGGPIVAREVRRTAERSPIRYFLDGAQRTLPVWHTGTAPVIVAAITAGILERHAPNEISLVPGTLVDRLVWVLPTRTGDDALNLIAGELGRAGQQVVDPLEREFTDDVEQYRRLADDYLCVLQRSLETAGRQRQQIEAELLAQWQNGRMPRRDEGWLLVDGQLTNITENAIGLVKSVGAQHFTGGEAAALYGLPRGHRTSAYALSDTQQREGAERAMWYLRMHDASGQDARHGLVRLESYETFDDPDRYDVISSWVLAERAPRPSSDARWPTLLYPVHLLERMLKRRIDALTLGWPA